jgi:hypothetical protein
VCRTPLLDVTQSLRIAASFVSMGNGDERYVFDPATFWKSPKLPKQPTKRSIPRITAIRFSASHRM